MKNLGGSGVGRHSGCTCVRRAASHAVASGCARFVCADMVGAAVCSSTGVCCGAGAGGRLGCDRCLCGFASRFNPHASLAGPVWGVLHQVWILVVLKPFLSGPADGGERAILLRAEGCPPLTVTERDPDRQWGSVAESVGTLAQGTAGKVWASLHVASTARVPSTVSCPAWSLSSDRFGHQRWWRGFQCAVHHDLGVMYLASNISMFRSRVNSP